MSFRGNERQALRRLINGFEGRRLLVIGDVMLDQYIRGGVSRISPEAPVPVVRVSEESSLPGGAGNVVNNLAALGAAVSLIGVVGDDEAGRQLVTDLRLRGIAVGDVVADRARVTSQKCRVVAERQQVVRFDRETPGPLGKETEDEILRRLPAAVKAAEAVILSDYGKGVLGPRVLEAAIGLSRKRGIPVTVDPKIEHFKRYKRVTCITPNLHEAWAGMHRLPKAGEEPIEELGREILKSLRCESVLITRGPEGMSLFNSHGHATHIPTRAREVFDVTGAGDTVIATLTLALAGGANIRQAAVLSNCAAGIVVGKLGTATAARGELLESIG